MKFLKSTLAIIALLAIVSVDAKVLTKKTQPAVQPIAQPVVTEQIISDIDNFINQKFETNYDEMNDVILDNYNEQGACEIIQIIAGSIVNQFPMNIPTAKKLFRDKMMDFCEEIQNDKTKMASIQQCIDNTMNVPSATIAPVVTGTGRGNRPHPHGRYGRQGRRGNVTPNK